MKTLRFGKLVVLVALTLCVVSGSFVVNAYADMWGDIADGLKNGGRTVVGDGYFKVQIHNNTNQTIWVAAIYGTEDRGITIFRKKGWWELSAGGCDQRPLLIGLYSCF